MNEVKTRDERIAELLDKPAIEAVSAIKGPSLSDITQVETKEEKVEEEVEETESGGKKIRIPASRLKTLTEKIGTLESKLQETTSYAERVTALEAQLAQSRKGEEELPEWWIEAYGDNDLSKQGYRNQQRVMRSEMEREFERRETERRAEESRQQERIQEIEHSFDTQMDELEDTLGRELTSTQKSELLDLVGEYSPQEDGKYIAYLPVAKAYEIWQKGQTNTSKQEIARIASIPSTGGSQATSPERPQWGDWRKRFGA